MIRLDATAFALLVLTVAAGMIARAHVAPLAVALACAVGLWAGLDTLQLAAAVPWLLSIRLVAITALFALAHDNGTLDRLALLAVRLVGGRPSLLGPLVFVTALTVAAAGAGNFAATALIAPVAMAAARRARIADFTVAVMIVYGATAGAFSPIAPTGLVARDLMLREGIPYDPFALFACTATAHALVAVLAFAWLRGWKASAAPDPDAGAPGMLLAWEATHWRTAAALLGFALLAMAVKVPVEWAAAVSAAALMAAVPPSRAGWVRRMPWRLIGLVMGVSMLAAVVDRAGGMAFAGRLLASAAGTAWLPGALALAAGLVSVAASSIGVVLPAFLPAVGDVVRAAGGGDPAALAYAVNTGAHLVDISPLSPLGAMCLACVPSGAGREALFARLMGMGLLMCPVGALICQGLFGHGARVW